MDVDVVIGHYHSFWRPVDANILHRFVEAWSQNANPIHDACVYSVTALARKCPNMHSGALQLFKDAMVKDPSKGQMPGVKCLTIYHLVCIRPVL